MATLIASALTATFATSAVAQVAPGDAPFINSWVISGPHATAVADEIYGTARPSDGNWARVASVTSSSNWKTTAAAFPTGQDLPSTTASAAVDGDLATNWVSQMHNTAGAGSTWPAWDPTPTLTLTWDAPIDLKEIQVFDRHDVAWPANTSDVQRVDYTLKGATGASLATGSITSIDPTGANAGIAMLSAAVTGVSKVELLIVHDGQKILKNVGLGFKEVKVFDGETASPTGGEITPEIGGTLEGKTWEYFDDRIWNRNYDDYQDLHGYFEIKKGVDTRNRWVYAASYVYSDTARDVQLRYGSSGAHRAFVNDESVDSVSTPAEVQKDMRTSNIHLDAGWNKILLQIKHTYTDDKNANQVPAAKDANVAYLGFYARLTDLSGNKVDGLTYSLSGDAGNPLTIDTRALSATDVVGDGAKGRGLPTNVLPAGYREWPYVWNTSFYTNVYGVSASRFRFLAGGGTPAYTWSVASGSLPTGLTLNPDGTVDGLVTATPGTYSFTVRVTDSASTPATATKAASITVKERPNRWLELGKVSALSHSLGAYTWFADPNFSADGWAERAKRQGHAMVSIESLQQSYYWPSRFADPAHPKNQYGPKDANGQVPDALAPFADAVKRHGMKFGLYYATEGGGQQHYSSDVFVQNVQDLILRYDPKYFYFDGPQTMPSKNFDAMYSIVRNYGDDIIIQHNAWSAEYGDPDLRTGEAAHIFANAHGMALTKRTVSEPWKAAITKYNPNVYYSQRDDYRLTTKEMIMNSGRGHIDNADQSPILGRGPNYDSATTIASNYPKAAQEYIDLRDNGADWWAPAGKPERHESITGTMPYFLTNPNYTDDGAGNISKFAVGQGPSWGYAMSRDNNIYLHLIQGPDNKNGYAGSVNGFADSKLTISPVTDDVQSVSWLNEDQPLSFVQTGNSLEITLTGVERDQIDTIIKVVTDNPQRSYPLTNVVATGKQLSPGALQINAEGYRTFTALKAPLSSLSYSSSNTGVASVNSSAVVTAGANGTATITVTGAYDGTTKSDTIDVKVASGKIYVEDDLIGAVLRVADREAYGEFSSYESHAYSLEGRAGTGGPIGLDAATVTMKAGVVDVAGATNANTMPITESSSIVTFAGGKVITEPVSTPTRIAVWAEVTLGGTTKTTNRVFMDLLPSRNVAKDATLTASGSTGSYTPEKLIDGKTTAGTRFDGSKWSVGGSGTSWVSFQLAGPMKVSDVEVTFNSLNQKYANTPESMEIQTSTNGTTWSTVSTVTPPTSAQSAFFGIGTTYPVDATTKYLRLNFPLGGNGTAPIDLQEVKVNGVAAPVLHWRLDETSGTAVADSSGNGKNGTVSGPPSWVTGQVGNALDLNGTSNSVAATVPATTKYDNVTMSAWIKWDGATSADQMIAYNGSSATSGYGIILRRSAGDRFQILAGGSGFVSSQVVPPVGQWTLVTAVRRSGTWKLYVNGENAPVTNAAVLQHGVTDVMKVGASAGASYFNGTVDDVKVYESALTDDEIRAAF